MNCAYVAELVHEMGSAVGHGYIFGKRLASLAMPFLVDALHHAYILDLTISGICDVINIILVKCEVYLLIRDFFAYQFQLLSDDADFGYRGKVCFVYWFFCSDAWIKSNCNL